MKQKLMFGILAGAGVMLLLPCLVLYYVSSEAAMLVSIIFLLMVNPIFVVLMGISAGKQIRSLWILPIVLGVLWGLGYAAFMGFRIPELSFYIGIYTILAYISMIFSSLIVSYRKKYADKKKPI